MNKFWLILLVKSVCLLGFELRTFDEGPHQQLAHQTSEHVSHALVPWAADETSEAVEARALWRTADTPTLEFVHIHKCGGQTFNVVAPELLCAQRWKSNASVHCSRCAGGSGPGGSAESILQQWSTKWGKCGGPCCVVRPDPSNSLPALLKKMPIKPRFVSDRGEFDAHVIPWVPRETFKAVMVRRPFERWISEIMYECRGHAGNMLPHAVGEYLEMDVQLGARVRRNRISQSLLPPAVFETSRTHNGPDRVAHIFGSYDRLRDRALDAAEHVLYSFAFFGVLEEYELSMCLFARTFLTDKRAICDSCCRQPKRDAERTRERAARARRRLSEVLQKNVAGAKGAAPNETRNEECNQQRAKLGGWGAADRDLFAITHAPDLQVYIIAERIFRARVALADTQGWGSTPAKCKCKFYASGRGK